ncbi:CopG family transcriptional regulator, partial [Campylobacter fetus]
GKNVNLYLKTDTVMRLDSFCKTCKSSKSALVDEIINNYMDSMDNLFGDCNFSDVNIKNYLFASLDNLNYIQKEILLKLKDIGDEKK